MSKPTLLSQGNKVQDYVKKAVDDAVNMIKVTFGPNAFTTLMYRTYNRGPRFVDDGYWTLESHTPKNPFVRLAYEAFKEAVQKTNRKVGDGTSATGIISGALYNDLFSKFQAKSQGYGNGKLDGGIQIKQEILKKANEIKEEIRGASKPIKTLAELEKISAISLGEENELSKTVAKMAWETGVDGFIDVVEGYKNEVETELIKGMRFTAKICGKAFVNKPERYEMVIEDCPVFITNHKLDNDLLVRFIIGKFEATKLIIIAPDFSEQVLVNMVLARQNGSFIWPVKTPSLRTEQMEDLAIYCGAKLYDKNKGDKLQNARKEDLGYIERLIVKDSETREDAVAIGGAGTKELQLFESVEEDITSQRGETSKKKVKKPVTSTAVQERIKILRGQLEETKENQFQLLMQRRIASMASAGGVIRVGSPTDAESLPLKLKIEDGVFACKAALKSGYVKGGGLCLKEIAENLPNDHILKTALLSPYQQIQENAGGKLVIGKDVIDPTDAVYYAVEYATSVVASLITIKNLIVEEPEIQTGENEGKIAQAIDKYTMLIKREKGLLSENEKLAEMDAGGGLTMDERVLLDNS